VAEGRNGEGGGGGLGGFRCSPRMAVCRLHPPRASAKRVQERWQDAVNQAREGFTAHQQSGELHGVGAREGGGGDARCGRLRRAPCKHAQRSLTRNVQLDPCSCYVACCRHRPFPTVLQQHASPPAPRLVCTRAHPRTRARPQLLQEAERKLKMSKRKDYYKVLGVDK
jgi:hypothetical protein